MGQFKNLIPVNRGKKNKIDLTHDRKGSYKFGYLYPTMVLECLPGETFFIDQEGMARFAPMVFPTMHRFTQKTEAYFVPNRICWQNWEDFITNKGNHAPPFIRCMADSPASYTTLMDHMGVPKPQAGQIGTLNIDAMPFMAYQKIWDKWYRQEQITPGLDDIGFKTLIDGDNFAQFNLLTSLHRRAWEHDMFTSCLPEPQLGAPVEIPFRAMEDMPVYRNSATAGGDGATVAWNNDATGGDNTAAVNKNLADANIVSKGLYIDEDSIDNGSTIEDLRRASAIQRFFERLMQAGQRIKEVMISAFGTDPGDARLQNPEFIGSYSSPINISEVLNTTGTAEAPQGYMAGHGIGYQQGKGYKYVTPEHGYIICVTSFIPMTAYQNGLPKKLHAKETYLDYYWPEFDNLGEEAVHYREIFAYDDSQDPTFGYLPRWYRYRTEINSVAGDFRTTLADFHFGRIFDPVSPPALSTDFIECNPGNRIFADTSDNDKIYAIFLNKVTAIRQVPKYSIPYLR